MKKTLPRWPLGLITALILAGCGQVPRQPADTGWLAAWGSAQLEQAPAAGTAPLRENASNRIGAAEPRP